LVDKRFGIQLSLASVGKVLAKVGLTPQKPLARAYERDPEAIEAWKRETYPSIAAAAKRDDAEIYLWDESGFRADVVQGTTWGSRARRRSSRGRASANRSRRPPPSIRRAVSGLLPIRAA